MRAAPAVAQIPDQRVGVLELAVAQHVLEQRLVLGAGVRPDAHVADALAVRLDDAGAVAQCGLERLARLDPLRLDRDAPECRRLPRGESCSVTFSPILLRNEPMGANGAVVGRDDLIAGEQAGARRRQVGEHGGHECLAVDVLGEHADAGIAYLLAREVLRDIATQRIGEDVDELVVGGLVLGVVVRVRGAELGEQRVDRGGALRIRLGGEVGETMLVAHRLPIEPLHLRVVELVAREAPNFLVDGGLLGLGLIGTRLGERQHLGAGNGNGHSSRADESGRTHVMTSRWQVDACNVGREMDDARMI